MQDSEPTTHTTDTPHIPSHNWTHQGVTYTFSWAGDADEPVSRVYALAFLPTGDLVLVSEGGSEEYYWLPGGGIEEGEDVETALARELREEIGGRLLNARRLGLQRVETSDGRVAHHAFYWARVELDDAFVPEHEITLVRPVSRDQFLDTLFWGRTDPKGEMLLQKACELEDGAELHVTNRSEPEKER